MCSKNIIGRRKITNYFLWRTSDNMHDLRTRPDPREPLRDEPPVALFGRRLTTQEAARFLREEGPVGRCMGNGGHVTHRAISASSAFVRRPHFVGGRHGDGGTWSCSISFTLHT